MSSIVHDDEAFQKDIQGKNRYLRTISQWFKILNKMH